MSAAIDLYGRKYGLLTVLERAENTKNNKAKWLCKCDCGNITKVVAGQLRSGKTKSCGCYKRKQTAERNMASKTVHGLRYHPLYNVWCGIKKRCENQFSTAFRWYGGRGIGVCKEWMEFVPFYQWAIENGYEIGLQLDRIDNDGSYTPDNCRFVTCAENQRNRRSCITHKGKTISQHCDEMGIKRSMVYQRLRAGWSVEAALSVPSRFATREEAEAALGKEEK